jgi:hypothetical protein
LRDLTLSNPASFQSKTPPNSEYVSSPSIYPFKSEGGQGYSKIDRFMHLEYNFMKIESEGDVMANLQIKGIDNELYNELKRIAAEENRSVSQQTLFLVRDYIAKRQKVRGTKSPAQVLLDLSGSWKDDRKDEEIISEIRKARKNLKKLKRGF